MLQPIKANDLEGAYWFTKMLVSKLLFGFCLCLGSTYGAITKVGSNILLSGTIYYTVAPSIVSYSDALDILASTDLATWNFTNAVFDSITLPCWTNESTVIDPDMNIIGADGIRIYFAAREKTSERYAVGVAFSNVIQSDKFYSTLNRPIIEDSNKDIASPSLLIYVVVNQPNKNYLVYVDISDKSVYSSLLGSDGLSVQGTPTTLVKPNWEHDVRHAWIVQSNEWHFIFYVSSNGTVGVARSQSALGPYIEKGQPIGYIESSALLDLKRRQSLKLDKQGWPSIN